MAKAPIPAAKAMSLPPTMRADAPLPGTKGTGEGFPVPAGGAGRSGGCGDWGSTVVGDWVRCGRSLSRCRCLGSS